MGIVFAIVLAFLGVACAAYGFKFFFSATNMRFHYFWFFLAVVFIAPALLMLTGLWDKIPAVLHWVMGLALLLFVVYEIVVSAAIVRHFHDTAIPGFDYVIVLGAQVLDGKPGRTFSRRLNAAYDYLSKNPNARCIVCGGQGLNESVPEARAGHDYLVRQGIASDRILLESESHSTAQNLRFAAKLIDPKHDVVGIVTNGYHVARALAVARKAGFVHAHGIAVENVARELPYNIARESLAWAKDTLVG